MRLSCIYRSVCSAPIELCNELRFQLRDVDWNDDRYMRHEPTLEDGRLLEMPYTLSNRRYIIAADSMIGLATQSLVDWINTQDGLNQFEPVRCEIAALLPGISLGVHRDRRWVHSNSRRMHIPIITNDKCWHTGGITKSSMVNYHMNADQLYELNNVDWHQAGNDGEEPRIHLIADFMPNGFLSEQIKYGIDPKARVPELSLPIWQQ